MMFWVELTQRFGRGLSYYIEVLRGTYKIYDTYTEFIQNIQSNKNTSHCARQPDGPDHDLFYIGGLTQTHRN
jgi:hypothetical protein